MQSAIIDNPQDKFAADRQNLIKILQDRANEIQRELYYTVRTLRGKEETPDTKSAPGIFWEKQISALKNLYFSVKNKNTSAEIDMFLNLWKRKLISSSYAVEKNIEIKEVETLDFILNYVLPNHAADIFLIQLIDIIYQKSPKDSSEYAKKADELRQKADGFEFNSGIENLLDTYKALSLALQYIKETEYKEREQVNPEKLINGLLTRLQQHTGDKVVDILNDINKVGDSVLLDNKYIELQIKFITLRKKIIDKLLVFRQIKIKEFNELNQKKSQSTDSMEIRGEQQRILSVFVHLTAPTNLIELEIIKNALNSLKDEQKEEFLAESVAIIKQDAAGITLPADIKMFETYAHEQLLKLYEQFIDGDNNPEPKENKLADQKLRDGEVIEHKDKGKEKEKEKSSAASGFLSTISGSRSTFSWGKKTKFVPESKDWLLDDARVEELYKISQTVVENSLLQGEFHKFILNLLALKASDYNSLTIIDRQVNIKLNEKDLFILSAQDYLSCKENTELVFNNLLFFIKTVKNQFGKDNKKHESLDFLKILLKMLHPALCLQKEKIESKIKASLAYTKDNSFTKIDELHEHAESLKSILEKKSGGVAELINNVGAENFIEKLEKFIGLVEQAQMPFFAKLRTNLTKEDLEKSGSTNEEYNQLVLDIFILLDQLKKSNVKIEKTGILLENETAFSLKFEEIEDILEGVLKVLGHQFNILVNPQVRTTFLLLKLTDKNIPSTLVLAILNFIKAKEHKDKTHIFDAGFIDNYQNNMNFSILLINDAISYTIFNHVFMSAKESCKQENRDKIRNFIDENKGNMLNVNILQNIFSLLSKGSKQQLAENILNVLPHNINNLDSFYPEITEFLEQQTLKENNWFKPRTSTSKKTDFPSVPPPRPPTPDSD